MNDQRSKIDTVSSETSLPANRIDIYYCTWKNVNAMPPAEDLAILSVEEKKHLARLRQAVDQVSYAKAHVLLRHTLQRYADVPAAELDFCFETTGKPRLLTKPNVEPIEFNLTHCQNLVACAIARSPIGIDAEPMDRFLEDETIEHFLHPQEQERFQGLNITETSRQFIEYWTCKEAALKAIGCGLTIEPAKVLIDFVSTNEATASVYANANHPLHTLKLYTNLVPHTAHSLAVATQASNDFELRVYTL